MRIRLFSATRALIVAAAFVVALVVRGAAAPGVTAYNIADGDVGGLIAAVIAANGTPGADTINLAPAGTYELLSSYDGDNGLPPIVDSLTINGNGATITRSGAVGTAGFRILLVSTPGSVTLSGLTISNGRKSGDFQGGAIRNFQGTLNLIGTTLTGNAAAFGGAIWNYASGTVNLINSTVSNNVADDPVAGGAGGGIYNYQGNVTLTDSTLHANSARSSGGVFNYQGLMTLIGSTVSDNFTTTSSNGGGMTNYEGTVTILNSTWSGNTSMNGGALFNLGIASLSNTTFSGNTATLKGGAIYSDTGGTLTVTNSTVSGNTAHHPSAPTSGYGGGIFNWGGSTATIANSTIAGNFTNFAGGGVYNNGNLTLTNVTIFDNRSTQFASGLASDSGGATTVRNSLFAGNFLGRNCRSFGPPIVSQGHNLSDDGTCTIFFGQPGDLNNTAAGVDPAGLTNNGGPTQTVGLAPGSAAIDAGDDLICSAAPISGVDQRGELRPAGPHCDIGAFEAAVTDPHAPVVSCASADGLWHADDVSLSCTATDDGSGLANAADASFFLTTNVAANVETANALTGSHEVCDNAGNCVTVGPIGGNMIDKRAPAVMIVAPTSTLYTIGQVVLASYSCPDGGSGAVSCAGPIANGLPVDTSVAGSFIFTVAATDAVGNSSSDFFSYDVSLGGTYSSITPATVWLGLKNSDDVGTKFDLLVEVLKNGAVVGSGQLDAVPGGSSGFNNAVARAIGAALNSPTNYRSGDTLGIRLSVRIAVGVPGHASGTARLWYNDAAANSRIDTVVNGVARTFYLRSGSALGLGPGTGPKVTSDVLVKRAGGNPFKPFGTWTIVF